ncbi:MAG: TIGR03619 family F420-dependent LLM class oxidoreductase [Acidimicrobiales bacterium]
MQLPIQAQSSYFVEPWEKAADRNELAAVVRACEAAGFVYVAVCDHVAIPRDKADAMSTTWFDTVATLSWIAGFTERVKLLSHVYVPAYRPPLVVAKAWATLDFLSGGRAILGVGSGHVEAEFAALGVPFAERGRRTDEAIDLVRSYLADEWAGGELGQRPRPVQLGGVPIWIGGSSEAALRRAAQRGDGWLPQGTPKKEMPEAIASIREQREQLGRVGHFTIGAITPFFWLGERSWDTGDGCLAGSPERIASYLQGYADMGVDQVQVRFRSRSRIELCHQIAAFGADVAPLLGRSPS